MKINLQGLGIDQLSVDDRISLAEAILDSLPVQTGCDFLTAEKKELLNERLH